MSENLLLGLAFIMLLAIGSQWVGWRFRVPSILLLLTAGFLAGPILHIVEPDEIFGKLLFPLVSLAVGVILFEGGLTLRLNELPRISSVIMRLVTLSALVTWGLAALAARYVLEMSWPLAVLLGAIVIVTGPTVVGPILRQVRPKGRIGSVLKWEGILIDPVGAVLAVLVFEAVLLGEFGNWRETLVEMTRGIGTTVVVGGFMGVATAVILVLLLRRRWIPDYLQNVVTLMLVTAAFAYSDFLQHESGLVTTTIMGIVLANQNYVSTHHIEEFTEDIQVMLIGSLFILLAARISLSDLQVLTVNSVLFLLILIIVVRPVAVAAATLFSDLSWRDWLFASMMAPRGIVAASVASIFAFELIEAGFEDAERLVPFTFEVIVGTVLFYGFAADWVARILGISERDPQGVLFVGGHRFARHLAKAIQDEGFRTMVMDTNLHNIRDGQEEGLNTYYGNALSEHTLENLDLTGIGRMMAMTSNNEVNALAALHFPEVFSRADVYQLSTSEAMREREAGPQHLRGRFLFDQSLTYERIEELMHEGAEIQVVEISDEMDPARFVMEYSRRSTVLVAVDERNQLLINTADDPIVPIKGRRFILLLWPPSEVVLAEAEAALLAEVTRDISSLE